MKGEYVFDLHRILLGEMSWFFLAEIVLRTAIVYSYALFVVRAIGKRGMGQLAPFDFVIIIALGSAVGDPMFYPNVPLLHALVAVTGIVFLTRGVAHLTQRSKHAEELVSADAVRLVRDGIMDLRVMRREGIARQELFETLRSAGVDQLGDVERAYLEPSGKISVFRQPPTRARAGLPLLPESVEGPLRTYKERETVLIGGCYTCWECGYAASFAPGATFPSCPCCQCGKWVQAVTGAHEALTNVASSE
ncbi:DUF421 domain-containing protein [Microvirga arabica]|uniref:DUF421 domain-containing protein n=1 Tax=Microvirga arabica TaxID=1128671 RepID=UPI00193AB623|nr:DUF421 domain-containing protein [Microvirga arabica]MBM1170057.1 DUF421 domain-containing protein [Microvirga arabica]